MYRDKVKITELEPGLGSFEFNELWQAEPELQKHWTSQTQAWIQLDSAH